MLLRVSLRLGLAVAGVAAMLAIFPAHVTVAGTRFTIHGSVLTHRSLSADTTVGDWTFPDVDGLPVGVHVSPVDVDLVRLASTAGPDPARFAARVRSGIVRAAPRVAAWLLGDVVVGVVLGLLLAAALELAGRQLGGASRRPGELARRGRQVLAAATVLVVIADVGVATYRPDWSRRSRLTGTLAALQLFPGDLQQYYSTHSKALDVLDAVAAIQSGLQKRIDRRDIPSTAVRIMFISDMHLAGTYPLVRQYARNFHVGLIVNTGDEAEFGTRAEMTPAYLAQLRRVTKVAPMIWLAGNHDSPATVSIMRSVPRVTVVGTKVSDGSGGTRVTAQQLTADGLRIAALPDPRIYGGHGAFGASDPDTVTPLEQQTVDRALSEIPSEETWDIFATHEPVAATQLLHDLPGRIRQTDAGHVHAQNSEDSIQSGPAISLTEGSTGAGGLDNLATGTDPPPLEFSIESVAADCQFTKIVRFQITGAAPASAAAITAGSLPRVSATTDYLTPQSVARGRTCGAARGVGPVQPITDPLPQ